MEGGWAGSENKQPNNQPDGEQQNNTQPWMLRGGGGGRIRGCWTKAEPTQMQRGCASQKAGGGAGTEPNDLTKIGWNTKKNNTYTM